MTEEQNEYFEAVGTIEAGIFMLREITKARGEKTPLEKIIDNATGYEDSELEQIVVILLDIMQAKKALKQPIDAEQRIFEMLKTK